MKGIFNFGVQPITYGQSLLFNSVKKENRYVKFDDKQKSKQDSSTNNKIENGNFRGKNSRRDRC